jgi:RNA polymerase sigma factor (sigma-70 family)
VKPLDATAIPVDANDEQLVARAQAGNSEAFAALFRRYRPAIARYAGRMLGDDARAEDIVQEVFLAALRSIDRLDRPAGFKPWLYRIAHNICVDHMRRNRRGEEVSMDAGALPAAEEIRLFRQAPSTHAAVTQKEEFRNLREAFGGLPPSQSEVLVLRELEGLSYDEIAARMGITRASVESMLFRARQGLRFEYGEIVTGERCLRMRPVMARVADGIGGLRDRRALARHVRGCDPCRREAYAMGLGGLALEAGGLRGGLSRVAALLPLPWLIHRRSDDAEAASAAGSGSSFAVHAQSAMTQLGSTMSVSADHAATGIQKAVAVVAAVAVVGGGGIVATQSGSRGELPLKPPSTTTPVRADVGPKVPPALLPISPKTVSAVVGGKSVVAAPAVVAGGGDPTSTTGVIAPAPGDVPGALDGPITPEAVASPTDPAAPDGSGGDTPSADAPDTSSGTETTLPAAGDSTPTDGGSGGGGGQTGGDTTGGDSGGSTDTGGSGSGGDTSGGTGGDTTTGDGDADCKIPPGQEKKDRIPPGQAKKCPELQAAGSPAP